MEYLPWNPEISRSEPIGASYRHESRDRSACSSMSFVLKPQRFSRIRDSCRVMWVTMVTKWQVWDGACSEKSLCVTRSDFVPERNIISDWREHRQRHTIEHALVCGGRIAMDKESRDCSSMPSDSHSAFSPLASYLQYQLYIAHLLVWCPFRTALNSRAPSLVFLAAKENVRFDENYRIVKDLIKREDLLNLDSCMMTRILDSRDHGNCSNSWKIRPSKLFQFTRRGSSISLHLISFMIVHFNIG
jgi:hypothetical protein